MSFALLGPDHCQEQFELTGGLNGMRFIRGYYDVDYTRVQIKRLIDNGLPGSFVAALNKKAEPITL